MPVYQIICQTCGTKDEVYARVSELSRTDGGLKCPRCGNAAEQDWSSKNIGCGNPRFTGLRQFSITEGWHPDEVGRVRSFMASHGDESAAACIMDDGRVVFRNRSEQQNYMKAKARLWERIACSEEGSKTITGGNTGEHNDGYDAA